MANVRTPKVPQPAPRAGRRAACGSIDSEMIGTLHECPILPPSSLPATHCSTHLSSQHGNLQQLCRLPHRPGGPQAAAGSVSPPSPGRAGLQGKGGAGASMACRVRAERDPCLQPPQHTPAARECAQGANSRPQGPALGSPALQLHRRPVAACCRRSAESELRPRPAIITSPRSPLCVRAWRRRARFPLMTTCWMAVRLEVAWVLRREGSVWMPGAQRNPCTAGACRPHPTASTSPPRPPARSRRVAHRAQRQLPRRRVRHLRQQAGQRQGGQ